MVRRWYCVGGVFFFQAEDGIRDLVRSRGLGDVYKRQGQTTAAKDEEAAEVFRQTHPAIRTQLSFGSKKVACLLYTSDAADERSSVDLGGRRIIKKKNRQSNAMGKRVAKLVI